MLEPQPLHEILAGIVALHSEHAVPGSPPPSHSEHGTSIEPSWCLIAAVSTLQIGQAPCLRSSVTGIASPATSRARTDWIRSPAAPSMNCGYQRTCVQTAIERIPKNTCRTANPVMSDSIGGRGAIVCAPAQAEIFSKIIHDPRLRLHALRLWSRHAFWTTRGSGWA